MPGGQQGKEGSGTVAPVRGDVTEPGTPKSRANPARSSPHSSGSQGQSFLRPRLTEAQQTGASDLPWRRRITVSPVKALHARPQPPTQLSPPNP